jgi:hypothetical protein
MLPTVVPPEPPPDLGPDSQLNVDPDLLHLIVTPIELDILVDALRSVGNVELAARFAAVLQKFGENARHGRHA